MQRDHRRVIPTYTYNRHKWLTVLARTPGARRFGSNAVGNQCRELGWTHDHPDARIGGEELTSTGRVQLALWNHERGEVRL